MNSKQTTYFQIDRVLQYFSQLENSSSLYKCKLCINEKGRSIDYCGKQKTNLSSHLKSKHRKEYLAHCSKSKECLQYTILRKEKIQSFVEIVTSNGRPFSYLHDSGFQRSNARDLAELSSAGFGISFDRNLKEVKQNLEVLAVDVRNEIKKKISDQFLSIMMDIGSKNNESFLGINTQYNSCGEIFIHTLGVIKLDKTHTAKYVVDKLIECLNSYEYSVNEIVASVTA